MNQAITITGLTVSYRGADALANVNLTINRGEFVNIIGQNGAGKTTLIRAMLGLIRTDSGKIDIMGKPLSTGRHMVGYVPQNARVDRSFPITVRETAETSFVKHGLNPFHRISSAQSEQVTALLEKLGIGELAGRQISELSGGEFQRLLIVRALACNPEILMLDEPTANIDEASSEKIYELLEELNRDGMTIVMVSHDLRYVIEKRHRTVCINRTVTFDGLPDETNIRFYR